MSDRIKLNYETEKGWISEKVNNLPEPTHERFVEFEHTLRYLFIERENKVTIDDYFSLESLYNSIMIFAMKERFSENNSIFLQNTEAFFYDSLKDLTRNHPDAEGKINIIKKFMEDFYIETKKGDE